MIGARLWKTRRRKTETVHCWRPRRSGFGELVQWDTSEHDWLEGREPVRYLLIDDATSWSWGRFVEPDATPHMAVLWEYLEKNGHVVEVYTVAIRCSPRRRRRQKIKPSASPRTG